MNRDQGKGGAAGIGDASATKETAKKAGFPIRWPARGHGMGSGRLRLRVERFTVEGSARVRNAKPLRRRQIVMLRHQIEGRTQQRRPRLGVVRVGGDEVNPMMVQKPTGRLFSHRAEASGERACRDLDERSRL